MKIVNEAEFKEEIKTGLVLVDFFATWCGPCRMMAPIMDEIAAELGNKVKVLKVDVDESESIARQYGIMSIPTIILFEDGEVREKHVGLWQKDEAVDTVKSYLK